MFTFCASSVQQQKVKWPRQTEAGRKGRAEGKPVTPIYTSWCSCILFKQLFSPFCLDRIVLFSHQLLQFAYLLARADGDEHHPLM